ncbi:MAG: hypothetical protein GX587_13520 [Bacteroidales bacterium]|nr:hypothetical protein [Bacteroidales bacterium]
MKKQLLLIAFAALTPFLSQAGPQIIGGQGAKQSGMTNAGTFLTFNVSSSFFNPGALGMMPTNFSFEMGGNGLIDNTLFKKAAPSSYTSKTDNPIGISYYFYGGARIGDNLVGAIAINNPFILKTKWEDNWIGRYLVNDLSFNVTTIQPTLAYQYNDLISFGAGYVYAISSFDFNKSLPIEDNNTEGSMNINGKGKSSGFNVGILVKPTETFSIGLSYRSKLKIEIEDAEVAFVAPASLSEYFPTGNTAQTSITLPQSLDLGISYLAAENLLIALSLNYIGYNSFDSIAIDYKTNTYFVNDVTSTMNCSNKLIPRIVLQYRASEMLTMRLGGYYEPSPADTSYFSPAVAWLDQVAVTAGLSLTPLEGFDIDLSLVYGIGSEKEASYLPGQFSGTYKSRSLMPGIGISYSF